MSPRRNSSTCARARAGGRSLQCAGSRAAGVAVIVGMRVAWPQPATTSRSSGPRRRRTAPACQSNARSALEPPAAAVDLEPHPKALARPFAAPAGGELVEQPHAEPAALRVRREARAAVADLDVD